MRAGEILRSCRRSWAIGRALAAALVLSGCPSTGAVEGPRDGSVVEPAGEGEPAEEGQQTTIEGVEPITHQQDTSASPRSCPQSSDEVRGRIPRGCDRVIIKADRIILLNKVRFEVDKPTLLESSQEAMRDLAALLEDHPEIETISIEAHLGTNQTRHSGRSLSRRRARAVRRALIKLGIRSGRLRATGFGGDKPIADTKTPEGRAKNRRIEFRIVSRGSVERIPLP